MATVHRDFQMACHAFFEAMRILLVHLILPQMGVQSWQIRILSNCSLLRSHAACSMITRSMHHYLLFSYEQRTKKSLKIRHLVLWHLASLFPLSRHAISVLSSCDIDYAQPWQAFYVKMQSLSKVWKPLHASLELSSGQPPGFFGTKNCLELKRKQYPSPYCCYSRATVAFACHPPRIDSF